MNDKISKKAVWGDLVSLEDEKLSPTLYGQLIQPPMMVCYKCSQVIPDNSAFCPWCQIELFVTCPKCGSKYSSQYPSCNQCGTNRKECLLQQIILALQSKKEQDEIKAQERIKEQERERGQYEQSLPKILKLSCSSWESAYGWGINVSWATLNVSLCQITIRRKGDNTYYPIDKSYDFSPKGEVMVDSSYFIDMLSVFRNSYTFILELTASNSDKSYVIHKEIEFKAYFPFYGVPTFYI